MADTGKIRHLLSLGFILTLAFFLKIPSLFEPNHYGDEGIYQTIGQALGRGAVLYRDIWDNKPPLLYLLYSLFAGDQFLVRFFSLFVGLLTIVVFYFLAYEIFPRRPKIILFSTFSFALLFSLPLLEGNLANAENFIYLPLILAFYLAYKNSQKIQKLPLFTAGLLLAISFLFKIVAVFDLAVLFLFLTIIFWGQIKKQASTVLPLLSGFAFPILVAALIFLTQGIFKEFLSATFSQNVSYVAWGNKFLGAWGGLIFKILLLGIFCLFLFWQRKKLKPAQLLIFLWWGFSLFNAFFAGRPWIHYLLVLVPSFSLLLGLLFQASRFRFLTFILTVLTLLASTKFWIYRETPKYYLNFFSFLSGKKTLGEYYSFWGGHVNRDYRVAQFLKLKTSSKDPALIWGNSAQIYALAKRPPASRYTVAYHMSFTPQAEEETIQSLLTVKPKYFIILLPKAYPLGNLETVLARYWQLSFSEEDFVVYEKIF